LIGASPEQFSAQIMKHDPQLPTEDSQISVTDVRIWVKGLAAAGISGGANGIVTGFAAIGIDPNHFNLAAGLRSTLALGGVSAAISAILGVALYLRQSPIPK
jgi:hypothetical protein